MRSHLSFSFYIPENTDRLQAEKGLASPPPLRNLQTYEPRHELSNNVVCATSKAYAQSDQSLCLSLEYSMTPRLLTEQHLEFLSLKGGCKARMRLHMSKCHIVGNNMSRLNYSILKSNDEMFAFCTPGR